MEILKGAVAAAKIKEEIDHEMGRLNGYTPRLAIVRVGEKPDDISYERNAIKKMEKLGLLADSYTFPADISDGEFKAVSYTHLDVYKRQTMGWEIITKA